MIRKQIRKVIDDFTDDKCLYPNKTWEGITCKFYTMEYCNSQFGADECLMKRLGELGVAIKVKREFTKPKSYHSPCLPYEQGYYHATIDHKEAGFTAWESLIEEVKTETTAPAEVALKDETTAEAPSTEEETVAPEATPEAEATAPAEAEASEVVEEAAGDSPRPSEYEQRVSELWPRNREDTFGGSADAVVRDDKEGREGDHDSADDAPGGEGIVGGDSSPLCPE